jgi:putative ABC transport system permease protein
MKARDIFSYSFSAIKLRKLRASLTILGVVIGIAAIVALLSITQGMTYTIQNQLSQGLATDTLIVTPGSSGGLGGGGGGFGGGGNGNGIGSAGAPSSNFVLYANYTNGINSSLSPSIQSAFAVITQGGYIENASGAARAVNTITGVDFAAYANAYGTTFRAAQGAIPFDASDDEIVVGARVADPRLNGTTFVTAGNTVKLSWVNFTSQLTSVNESMTGNVTAVLERIGGFSFVGPSDTGVYIPLQTAERFFGTDQASMIIVKLVNSDNATAAAAERALNTYFQNQVTIISPSAVIGLLTTIINILGLFVAGIAAISLLVAGIGIMNIMIVSLIERTREIGILKALGMKSRTVLGIFLGESLIIGIIGGVLGIIAGWALGRVVAVIVERMFSVGSGLTLTPILTPLVVFGALAFGIGVSVIFALYPAWRASKLKPVDALRYE